MVPLMNLLYKKKFVRAVSISSLALVMISFSAWLQLGFSGDDIETLTPYHGGYVDFGAALPLAFGGLIGGLMGAFITLRIKRQYLQYSFAVLAIVMAIKLITEVF